MHVHTVRFCCIRHTAFLLVGAAAGRLDPLSWTSVPKRDKIELHPFLGRAVSLYLDAHRVRYLFYDISSITYSFATHVSWLLGQCRLASYTFRPWLSQILPRTLLGTPPIFLSPPPSLLSPLKAFHLFFLPSTSFSNNHTPSRFEYRIM